MTPTSANLPAPPVENGDKNEPNPTGTTTTAEDAPQQPDPEPTLEELQIRLGKQCRRQYQLEHALAQYPEAGELEQFEHRRRELDQQMARAYNSLQDYYRMFNTLERQKNYLTREVGMLVSVQETLPAIASSGNSGQKAHFLTRMEGLVHEVTQVRQRAEAQLIEEEKVHRKEEKSLWERMERDRALQRLEWGLQDAREENEKLKKEVEKL